MNTAIAPSTMPARTAPSPSSLQAAVDRCRPPLSVVEADLRGARARRRERVVDQPDAHGATFGTIASTIAA